MHEGVVQLTRSDDMVVGVERTLHKLIGLEVIEFVIADAVVVRHRTRAERLQDFIQCFFRTWLFTFEGAVAARVLAVNEVPELRDEVEASPLARLFKTLGCSTCAVERAPIEPHLRAREVPRVVNITILHVRDDAEPHAAVAPRVQSLRDG